MRRMARYIEEDPGAADKLAKVVSTYPLGVQFVRNDFGQ